MNNRSFSIGYMIKLGWAKFKAHPLTWVSTVLLTTFISILHFFFNYWLSEHDVNAVRHILFPLLAFLYFLVEVGLNLGLTYMGLRAARGEHIHMGHLFYRFQYVFHYLIASLLYIFILCVGLLLFFFPAAIWASRFSLYIYFIIDQGVGPIKALKKSSETTYGAKWDIFAFFLTGFCLISITALPLLIGLVITKPILNIAFGCIYTHLAASSQPTATN